MANFWKLKAEKTFFTDVESSSKILYHSNLNIIIIVAQNGEVFVVDVISGTELHKTRLSENAKEFLEGVYLKNHNKLVFTDGVTLGMRSDYNGILLLDTILQPIIEKPYERVEIELPLFEALLIYQALKQVELPAAESVIDLTSKLEEQIAENGINAKKGVKAEKWNTIRLKAPHNSLKWVASTMTSELRRQNRYVPALSIASAINERLNCLLPSMFANTNPDRGLMFSEANRRETFTKWPHMDYKWALPDQMAQAGFYHQPNTIGDDRAMCFTCVVCLVCWESTDEPWSEHERHAPTCPFVRGEYTMNVPLSVNYATAPAITLQDRVCFGTSSLADMLPAFSRAGVVTLYNISRFFKIVTEFHVPATLTEPRRFNDVWQQGESPRNNTDMEVTACSVFSAAAYHKFAADYEDYAEKMGRINVDNEVNHAAVESRAHPCVVVAVKRMETTQIGTRTQLTLAVYDFHYKDVDDGDSAISSDVVTNEHAANSSKSVLSKKSSTGTGTSISRNKECEYYGGKIYEASTALFDDINLMETESQSPNQTLSINNSLQSAGSFMFPPLITSAQIAANTTGMSEQVESILSSTSTGTVSSSEEKRDAKTDADAADENSRGDGSKSTLPKIDSMDLDKEATLSQQICIVDYASSNLEIIGLYPSPNGQHLVAVCRAIESNTMQAEEETIGGFLMLFKIDFRGSVLGLEETPSVKRMLTTLADAPKEFVTLPMFLKRDETYLPDGDVPIGAMLTVSGELHLLNLITLETISVYKNDISRLASIVYCDYLEKLCACDENGGLHYISIVDSRALATEPKCDEDTEMQKYNEKNIAKLVSNLSKDKWTISLKQLKLLYRLTHFENVVPCYLADVPACWCEVKQAQKQRRHPQLLHQGDSEQHTRTWKLQIGERTWDEHVFELTLQQSMCIGHVDVKFSLHPSCLLIPSIQVTLLRLKDANDTNKSTGECSQHADTSFPSASKDTHAGIPFSNPVTSKEYHLRHNTEILCGPISLIKYLDLSKRSGTVTLTSPKLFHSCCRSLLLHIKALGGFSQETTGGHDAKLTTEKSTEKKKNGGGIPTPDMLTKHSKFYNSIFMGDDHTLKKEANSTGGSANNSKRPTAGCDWIHEISVTIRKPKRVEIPHERLERYHMLRSTDFVDGLLEAFCNNDDPEYRLIAADILIWVASVRMCRYRPVQDTGRVITEQNNFARAIEAKLESIVRHGYIESGRKLAHKMTKFLIACSVGCKNAQDAEMVDFDIQLLKAMVEWIPRTLQCWSAGAFRWFFQLLLYVLPHDKYAANAPQKCFALLTQIAKELHSRQNPYHLLLRTRYGLYGNPFESELFDVEPIVPGKSSAVPVTYANLVAGPNVSFGATQTNEPAMSGFFSLLKPSATKDMANKMGGGQKYGNTIVMNTKTDPSFLTGISASHYMKGLLEVEPLHFTCHATSDGTRVERLEVDVMDEEAIVNYYGPVPTAQVSSGAFHLNPAGGPYDGLKKTDKVYIFQDLGDIGQTPLESLVTEETFQHLKMNVIPKIKQAEKGLQGGSKQLIVIDSQVPGPSYVPTPIYHDKITYAEVPNGFSDNGFPWQQLLVPPPRQTIVIDRMHSGAKRFVVLDFGFPICLTDMLVPPCSELLSLSVDIWTQSEEIDGRRLVVASDIGSKMLIMSDIQPPPICRYLKITVIGRYGMNTSKCRIPIGTFYGHSYVLSSDGYAEENSYFRPNSEINVQMLCGMMEDVQCRYGLVSSRLREQLTPFLTSEMPNVDHMNHYLNKGKTKNTPSEIESHRITNLYKDCITFQHQMNLVRHVMNRIGNTYPKLSSSADINVLLASTCTDKLRSLTEALLDLLMYFVYELGPQVPSLLCDMLNKDLCLNMFSWLCVGEDCRTQISTCTLLVRLYGMQPGWGEFLVNTFTQLYSSNYQAVFPQDRVFVLLSYLGRKSIMSVGNQNNVIEHILKALLKELLPLADTTHGGFVRGKLDLPLLSWLLMFFLQCVEVLPTPKSISNEDGDSDKDNDAIRWNFIQSEVPVHRKRMLVDKKGLTRNFRRAIQKNVMQNKQQPKDLEAAKKTFQLSTQALGKLSTQALKLTEELQSVLKSIPMSVVSSSQKFNVNVKVKRSKEKYAGTSNRNSTSRSTAFTGESSSSGAAGISTTTGKLGVDKMHCLPVMRALVAFMLHVDITCNVDLFLVSCKVTSCLLQISNGAISLSEILSEDQLLKLMQMAIWCENGKSMCGGKWTSHAIVCLLQDIMDRAPKNRVVVRARRKSSVPLESGSVSTSNDFGTETTMEADATDSFTMYVGNTTPNSVEESSKDLLLMCSSTPKCDNSQLPSLMESDDSEADDNLEEFLLDDRNATTKDFQPKKTSLLPNISVAVDSRLEYGVEESVEIFLRNLADKSSCNLLHSVNVMLPVSQTQLVPNATFKMDHLTFPWMSVYQGHAPSTSQMFSTAFERLFTGFNICGSDNNLEETLSLWLLLSTKNNAEQDIFGSAAPLISISTNVVCDIMTAAGRRTPLSIRMWYLLFKTLTVASNSSPEEEKSKTKQFGITEAIIQHEQFANLLTEFLSSPFVDDMAGENVVQTFTNMLNRIGGRVKAGAVPEDVAMRLKDNLLAVLCNLLSNSGAIACRRGPLDAQIAFLSYIQECEFANVGVSKGTDIVMKIGDILPSYVMYMNTIKCCTSAEIPANAASCFAPPSLKSATAAQSVDGRRVGPFTRDFLMMQILRFAGRLLRTSSETSSKNSDTNESQTDESKVIEQMAMASEREFATTKSILADIVLRHDNKMYQFLNCLNSCYRSSLLDVSDWHSLPTIRLLTNHSTVADGIYNFLITLFSKASDQKQKVTVLCGFLSNTTFSYVQSGNASLQISDPMLWLLRKVLGTAEVIRYFAEIGGVEIICKNLSRCFTVMLNQHSSTVSSVMQYMYGPHGFNVPSTAIKGKKKHTVDRNEDGLINFAPLGTIVLDNPGAQPADVLLMSATPHRRARSAAWSYHFYPEEKSIDLKILLPCAILLKEVHLQPHHMSLATSPKAISVEISRGGGEYIPIQAPVRTSGLAFLHMTLYQPEVVTSVLIRCYKPKESSGIGLSHIRLMGYSAFGDRTLRNSYNDIPTERQIMNTTIAWLRLYYHQLSIVQMIPDLEERILDTLAQSADSVSSVCGLLLLPSPLPLYFNRIIGFILLKLSLHSKELCLTVIRTVLRDKVGENCRYGKPMDPAAMNSVFELLHQICCTQDQYVADRVKILLNWLVEVASMSILCNNVEIPIPTYVYCVSCILWASQEKELTYDLASMLTPSLFDLLLEWSSSLPLSSALKRAVDRVLCSMYVIKPENFVALLKRMSIVFTAPDADAAKEWQHQFLHVGQQQQTYFESCDTILLTSAKRLFMSEKMFATLATISQSHISSQQLIGCGFLTMLADIVIEFCEAGKTGEQLQTNFVKIDSSKRSSPDDLLPMIHVETISAILNFFSELCWEGSVRTWLGSAEICVFWRHLLEYLCCTVPSICAVRNDLPTDSLLKLEDATIKFLAKCCWCYPKNQKTLTRIVYSVIDATPRRYSKYNFGITDFTRRVLLQLILETEKIFVWVETDILEGLNNGAGLNGGVLFPSPPAYPSSSRDQLLYLNTSYTCVDIINRVVGNNETTEATNAEVKVTSNVGDNEVEVEDDVMDEYCDKITLAAGVTAKDKRLKDSTSASGSSRDENPKKLKKMAGRDHALWTNTKDLVYVTPKLMLWVPTEAKYVNVCQDLMISQMLQLLADKGDLLEKPMIKFLLVEHCEEAVTDEDKPKNFLEEFGYSELPSVLKEFIDTRGLEMVAHRLPMVYPTHYLRIGSTVFDGTPTCHHNDPSWVKLDVNDDIYEEVMDEKGATTMMTMGGGTHPEKRVLHTNDNTSAPSIIPPHSLMAFGQFLKLPNYAEWLIRDRKQAQCLLRLVLGGGDETDFNIGNDSSKSVILNSLPTLPFEILRCLFKSTPLMTDDGMDLRISALKHGAIHVVLACLAIFTHQPESVHVTESGNQHVGLMMALKQCCSSVNSKKSEDKSHQYWAKGTGFGTGSTTQSWNVEQALCRQRFEEEHVTVFLQILACYINPDFTLQDRPSNYVCEETINVESDNTAAKQSALPPVFIELIEHSCLLPALASYLRNDSVLDMARHIPLYRAILVLLRVMALNAQLVKFLLPVDYSSRQGSSKEMDSVCPDQSISLVALLQTMKNCVDTYSSRLKKNKGNGEMELRHNCMHFKGEEEEDSGEGLTTLIPDIRATAKIVETVTQKIVSKTNSYQNQDALHSNIAVASIEEMYLQVMKKLQFDMYDMISEDSEGLGLKFNVSYHFEPNVHSDGDKNHPSRMKRLAQEAVTLSTSLPLSFSSSVFVRCDTDRLDVMKVLITGPAETPYANGCFEFDVYFPPDYPNSPMLINLETTGRHSVRFNPNLYNDGKVCLSVLNTWHGRPEEKWNAHTSSFLQVLVSIQSLILVPEPYFNEPGYERSRGTASGNQSSREYNANIMQATVRWAMLDQIRNPSPCFKEIIHTHFWLKRNEITKQITNWINEVESEVSDNSKSNRSLSHGTMSLKCHFKMLCDELAKLNPPVGFEEMSKCSHFEYNAPSSPLNSTMVELSSGMPGTSSGGSGGSGSGGEIVATSSSSLQQNNVPVYVEMEKLMSELD